MKRYLSLFLILALTFALTSCGSTKKPVEDVNLTPQELIKAGRINEARNQFIIPCDINGVDDEGNTVLHLAAEIDNADLVTFFIIKGANPDQKNYASDTPLHVAIKKNSYASAKVLSQMGSDIFARDGNGISALDLGFAASPMYYDYFITEKNGRLRDEKGQSIVHYFVKTKNLKAIEYCIKNGLDISVADNEGKTPLDLAFDDVNDSDSVEIAANLIRGGANEVETDFSYFQDAVSSRNLSIRFEDNQTPLHLASIMGHSAIAEYLLENNADTDVQDSSGSTPLHEAVRYGNIDIVSMLLNSGANINAKDNLGKTPIMVIMPYEKMKDIYKLLVSFKADLTQKDAYGDTPIHTATMMHAPVEVLELLVENGADVNTKNKEGVTPLEIAIQHHNKDMTSFYALNDADIHTKDKHGISPLILALNADRELFEMTVSAKNVKTQDSDGNTPLHVALLNNAPIEKILYIISLTDDVNIRNSDGNSVLYIACTKEQEQVVKALLHKGGDIFSTNKDSDSPLRIALRSGSPVQDWIINSSTITKTDGSGNTCLHYAAEWQFKNAIKSLVEKGADPTAKNANGETVLFSAVKTDNPEIIDTVVLNGTPVNERDYLGNTPLHMAVRWDAAKSIKKLLAMGIDINAQNSSGKSAMSEAALSGKMKTAKVLLNNGADVNSSDIAGCTILMDAIKGQNKNVVKLLLDYNANVSIQDINGSNAYHEAALSGDIDIINMIRNAGGNPLSRDKAGNTPFSLVVKRDLKTIKAVLGNSLNITDSDGNTPITLVVKNNGSAVLLKELIKMGYPIDGRNSNGYTALTYAVEDNNLKLATILLDNKANPFQSIDRKGQNAVTIALDKNNKDMISAIVKKAGNMTDIQGNTILHYAAKASSSVTVRELLAFGIPKNVKNISGETPYTIATRWNRSEVAELLK